MQLGVKHVKNTEHITNIIMFHITLKIYLSDSHLSSINSNYECVFTFTVSIYFFEIDPI